MPQASSTRTVRRPAKFVITAEPCEMIPPMRTSHSTRFHTIAVVAGLAEVAGILRFLVHPRAGRAALSRRRPADHEGKSKPQQFCGFHEPGEVPSGLDNGLILECRCLGRRPAPATCIK